MKRVTINDLHEGDRVKFQGLDIPGVNPDQVFTVFKHRTPAGNVKIRWGIDFFTYANIPNWRRMKFEIVERAPRDQEQTEIF